MENFTFEVDEFLKPITKIYYLAEIELPRRKHMFRTTPLAGQEVTGDPSYYNAMM